MRLTGILVVIGVLLCAPAAALADISGATVSVTPSTTAAGAHPDVTVDEKFTYSGSDSVKDTTLHFPPGLIGNPLATPLCPQASFQADTCPANTQVGTTSVNATVFGLLPTVSDGKIYNLVPSGNEPALLGIVVAPLGGLAGKIFLTSVISLRTATDFGIDSAVRDMPNSTSGLPTTITEVQLTLNGLVGGQPFMTNPTSCKSATTVLDADSYTSSTASASSTFTPTACNQLRFAPHVAASMGAPGATGKAAHVPFTATISQGAGESSQSSAAVTLPAGLGASIAGATVLCPLAQFAADTCPAGSRVGTATISTPLLADPVSGPVYEVPGGTGLPGVAVSFGGKLPFKLTGKVAIAAGGRVQNVFNGLPDVPLSTFTLAIDGGPHGILQAADDLCAGPQRTVDGTFSGQSGASASVSAPVTIVGCTPTATAAGRGFRGKRPRLSVTVLSARGGALLKSVSIKLPSDLRVANRSRGISVQSAAALPRSAWQLSKKMLSLSLGRSGSSRISATLSGGSIRAGSKLAKKLRRHRSAALRLTVTAVDTSGHSTVIPVRFSARR
jgi:hypothetical protein